MAHGQDREIVACDPNVGARVTEGSVADSTKNRMGFLLGDELDAGALFVIAAVVPNPGVAKDLMSEAILGSLGLGAKIKVRVLGVGGNLEGMGGGSQADNGAAAIQIIDDVDHLIVGEILEAGEDDHQICILQGLETGNVGLSGFEFAVVVDSETDRAGEPVMLRENASEGWKSFLGAIFVITGNEDEVFALSHPLGSFVDDRFGDEWGDREAEK